MLKLFQLLSAFLVFGILSFAQPGQVFFDNFDSYLHWQRLVAQNPIDWRTFSRPYTLSQDPFVSEAQSFSGSNSVVFIPENDIVYLTPAVYTDRVYIISFLIYVPTGSSGAFGVLQHFIPDPNSSYGINVFMPSGGIGTTDAGGIGSATFNFPHDSWFECKVEVDLDNDLGRFIVNSNLVIEWQWSTGNTGNNNLNQLEGAVFCCATNFLDDFSVVDLLAVPVELTSFTANVNAEGNVLLNWTTATETNNQITSLASLLRESYIVRRTPSMSSSGLKETFTRLIVSKSWESPSMA